ncbi:MAG: hypothetical protein KGI29_02095 [Pseudomonadota bacterium]|nr:hypothetical protein [Pseudomonadota bacterium]MDE3037706.1 hypothetical protein [Pseudomonadota bacterium]
MSAISNLSGGYYQLNNPGAGLANAQQAPNATDALLQAMSSSDGGGNISSPNSDAFLLDLSPQAQQIIGGMGGAASTGAASAADIFGGGGNFILSAQQQQQVGAILAKYKDAPYTQDTFNKIQNDLNAAGLGPSLLSLKDQTQSFDPALVLIDALNGTATDSSSGALGLGTNAAGEQTKTANYMQGIIQQWQNISTTYKAQNNAAPAAGTAGA